MEDHLMRARFATANAYAKENTASSLENALAGFKDMLRLDRRDKLGARDIIPHLLLQLGREQECYDFLKWWATVDDEDHYNGRYDWDNATLPYLDIRGANVFEPINMFCSGDPSLSHLVALTLLKLRLYLDFTTYRESEYGLGFEEPDPLLDRPVGKLVRAKMRTMNMSDVSTTVETLKNQYRRLCGVVHDANSHFWDALISGETCSPPPFYGPGSKEEANMVLNQCRRAWEESEDAVDMAGADTCKFVRVYTGPTAAAGVGSGLSGGTQRLQKRRGTGNAFPLKFKPPLPTSLPADLFPPTPMGRDQTLRFVSRNDRRKALAYVDGACLNNGQLDPQAGWAVVCGTPGNDEQSNLGVVSGRLEDKGPFGGDSVATSNRAELRAAIAALRFCDWKDEGFDGIVIATDSSYVVDGATGWVKGWTRNGWTTRTGVDVKNKDLWELLLGEVERWKDQGLRVDLWKIPRELNGDADAAAKQAAHEGAAKAEFEDVVLRNSETTAAEAERDGRILMLCIENESLVDACCASLISQLTSKAKMERVTTAESAIAKLSQEPSPSIILDVDGALTRHKKVWECVIDHLRDGATVVLAGCFSSMVNTSEFNRLFGRLGLPWQSGSYYRTTVKLRRGAVSDDLANRLPTAYSQKALYAAHVERSDTWYTETETSGEAAVAFAKVGLGRLGYIGDVNGEEGSEKVVLAMCGLLD
ncbi:hypothetical protein EDB81DRAFT_813866 [Dactylonectria macrodidyma]|uniref:ribonuclease H n=1 Tax=Dactylonectria macrodidyma TaxID=307937 RepID=A0A9P9DLX4_9HYPO|nr:hypothetical protein EDB81DRAFT_813866 [Dactylonectria macrodidyma]